jgi:hypothetical protein
MIQCRSVAFDLVIPLVSLPSLDRRAPWTASAFPSSPEATKWRNRVFVGRVWIAGIVWPLYG